MRYIGSPLLPGRIFDEPVEDETLFKIAFRNNIEMLYLAALDAVGKIDKLREQCDEINARQHETLQTIVRLSSVLTAGGIEHAVTKT